MRVVITLLQYDHGIIRQVIDVLGEMIKKKELANDRKHLQKIVQFLDEFVDQFHHAKEETFIFPAAVRDKKDMKAEIDALLADHKKARLLIIKMKKQVTADRHFDEEKFRPLAKEMVEHMTQHISHEENKAFPEIEELLTLEEDMELAMDFDRFTRSKFDPGFMKRAEDFSFKLQDEVLGPGYFQGIR
jgi:hemerythrin-like domain-containing protein